MIISFIDHIRYTLSLEYKRPAAFAGTLLFAVSVVFLVYKGFVSTNVEVLSVLYWIIILFVGINGTVRSFAEETSRKSMFYYSMWNPYMVLLAKVIYNFLVMVFFAAIILVLFFIFFEFRIMYPGTFVANVVLSCFGISICFSFVSAVASQGSQTSILMSILAIPAVIPIFLSSLKITANALGFVSDSDLDSDFIILGGIDLLLFGITLLLFPSLWKS